MGNAQLDAYVLSESSLFITPRRLVLKTCGTTRLLAAVPRALAAAASVGLAPARVKYSRASFLFPDAQPEQHKDFGAETRVLGAHFGHLGGGGGAYVLGDALSGLQWHVFVADAGGAAAVAEEAAIAARAVAIASGAPDDVAAAEAEAAGAAAAAGLPAGHAPTTPSRPPTYTLEVCMTGLDPVRASQFARGPAYVDAATVSAASGVSALLPGAALDDFVFDPCGYSANALDGAAFATIHVTPEPHCSYASVELCGYAAEALCPSAVVARVAAVFGASRLSVAMSVDADVAFCPWLLSSLCFPAGYTFAGAAAQDFGGRGRTAFYCLAADDGGASGLRALTVADDPKAAPPSPPSPRGPLRLSPSLFSATSSLAAALASPGGSASCDESSDGERCAPGAPPRPVRTPSPAHPLAPPPRAPSPAAPLLPGGGATTALASMLDRRSPALAAAAAAPRAPRRPPAPAPLPAVLAAARAVRLPDGGPATIDAALAAAIARHGLEDNTYCVDLGAVARTHAAWAAALPRVDPFYAVKCNPDPAIVATLAACGAGFDCASAAEVDLVLALGVPPHRIIFANACKRPSDVRAATAARVSLTTFDTPAEAVKLARWHPSTRALLRLRADDPAARCQLGNKYGCDPSAAPALLAAAKAAGVAVVGISFHVGSGASDPAAFVGAIELARAAFDAGTALGFDMTILDIGGGFAAPSRAPDGALDLGPAPSAINAALDTHFPRGCGVRVIAEPGRYFAEGCATLAVNVYGVRDTTAPCGAPTRDYWVTDGLYGSMNCVLYDHATLAARPLGGCFGAGVCVAAVGACGAGAVASVAADGATADAPLAVRGDDGGDATACCRLGCCGHVPPGWRRSTVFGPTCDGLDTVLRDYPLPLLTPGDWLAFPNMGAYTLAGASAFNGFFADSPSVVYVWSER